METSDRPPLLGLITDKIGRYEAILKSNNKFTRDKHSAGKIIAYCEDKLSSGGTSLFKKCGKSASTVEQELLNMVPQKHKADITFAYDSAKKGKSVRNTSAKKSKDSDDYENAKIISSDVFETRQKIKKSSKPHNAKQKSGGIDTDGDENDNLIEFGQHDNSASENYTVGGLELEDTGVYEDTLPTTTYINEIELQDETDKYTADTDHPVEPDAAEEMESTEVVINGAGLELEDTDDAEPIINIDTADFADSDKAESFTEYNAWW